MGGEELLAERRTGAKHAADENRRLPGWHCVGPVPHDGALYQALDEFLFPLAVVSGAQRRGTRAPVPVRRSVDLEGRPVLPAPVQQPPERKAEAGALGGGGRRVLAG